MALILNSLFIEILIVFTIWLTWGYYKYRTEDSKFWSLRNIPHLSPIFLLGNNFIAGITENPAVLMADLYQNYKKKKALGYWTLHTPILTIFDLDILKNILVRDFANFHDRYQKAYDKNDPLTGNLFHSNGQTWRNLRVKLTPVFTSGKMKMMYPTMMESANDFDIFLAKSAKAKTVIEAKDALSRFTMNIIASCAFGIETDAFNDPNLSFFKYSDKILNPPTWEIIKSLIIFAFPRLAKLLKLKLMPRDTTEFFLNTVKETIQYRLSNKITRNDFMQLLIQLMEMGEIEDADKKHKSEENCKLESNSTKFTMEDAAAQSFVFFLAGFETSSATMSFCLDELGRNIDLQRKVREEIKEAVKNDDGQIKYETILKLPYLDMVIKETLRKYPVVPFLMREVTKDYFMSEFDSKIPKGTLVFISLLGISRDPEIFENPEKFDPERFSSEAVGCRHPFSSIPFGEGPRICIGQRFGMLQMKIGLATILQKYSVELISTNPIVFDPRASAFLKAKGGINVKLHLD